MLGGLLREQVRDLLLRGVGEDDGVGFLPMLTVVIVVTAWPPRILRRIPSGGVFLPGACHQRTGPSSLATGGDACPAGVRSLPGGRPIPAGRLVPVTRVEGGPSREALLDALRGVIDPELGDNIVDLGMVRSVDAHEGGRVEVEIALTIAGCPFAPRSKRT